MISFVIYEVNEVSCIDTSADAGASVEETSHTAFSEAQSKHTMQVKSTKCPTMKRRLKHHYEQVLLHSAVSALETVSKRACYQQQNENSTDKLFANYVAAEIATVKDEDEKELLKHKSQGLILEAKMEQLKKKKQTQQV